MKFILKLLLAPLMLVLWIVEWVLTLALKASAVVCVIASALFLLSGVFTLWTATCRTAASVWALRFCSRLTDCTIWR